MRDLAILHGVLKKSLKWSVKKIAKFLAKCKRFLARTALPRILVLCRHKVLKKKTIKLSL